MRNIKNLYLAFFACFCHLAVYSQALPVHRYSVNKAYVIDLITLKPSFAFSARRLSLSYTGFALRVRRSADNAEADLLFDVNDVVSDNSTAKIAITGTSGLAINGTMTLATFRSGSNLNVSIWYDQSINGYNAIQTVSTMQPVLEMNSAGDSNQYPSLLFAGLTNPKSVVVNRPMETLLGNVTTGMGLRGTVGLVAKTTSNSNQFSFGYSAGAVRWSSHINWSDGNCYVDLGNAGDINRSFVNGSRLNLYKQYTFSRGNSTKTLRISGAMLMNNLAQNQNAGLAGGTFGIGVAISSPANTIGFSGNIPEFILYPEYLSLGQMNFLETSQLNFWKSY
jgi:hypothetical protein